MDKLKKYFHWVWGDNNIRPDNPHYLINLEIGISIRFNYAESIFADYDDFYNGIADVQFLFGERPNDKKLEYILTDAYNFLCIEERLLEADIEDLEDELNDNEF